MSEERLARPLFTLDTILFLAAVSVPYFNPGRVDAIRDLNSGRVAQLVEMIWFLVFFVACLVVAFFVWRSTAAKEARRKLRQVQEAMLCEGFRKIGLDVTVMDRGSQLFIEKPLSQFGGRSYGWSSYSYERLSTYSTWGCLGIEGHSVDSIQIVQIWKRFSGNVALRLRSWEEQQHGMFTDSEPTVLRCIYSYNYVVTTSVKALEKELQADFVTGSGWTGGRLAQMLNADTDLEERLLKLGLNRVEIRPHLAQKCVSITPVSPDISNAVSGKHTLRNYSPSSDMEQQEFPTMDAIQTYDRIAQHIRNISENRFSLNARSDLD